MKKLFCLLPLLIIAITSFGQSFTKPTNTETLKEQTMMFKQDFGKDKSISLVLWGQKSGLGAIIELVDMTESPRPTEVKMQYQIESSNTLYLLVKGQKFRYVVFHNDTAYLYSVEDEKLWIKLPRTH